MRFYEKPLPDTDEIVMCQVRQIAEMGAYVKLLEYDNAEGMILLSELSRRRIRSIQKLIRVGRNEVVVVLRVDKEKGYIDLSKRRVSPEDVIKCEERYQKSRAVNSIVSHVAGKLGMPVEELYQTVVWPLDRTFGHSYDAFKLSVTYVCHAKALTPASRPRCLTTSRSARTCAASSRRTLHAASRRTRSRSVLTSRCRASGTRASTP